MQHGIVTGKVLQHKLRGALGMQPDGALDLATTAQFANRELQREVGGGVSVECPLNTKRTCCETPLKAVVLQARKD